MREPMTLTRREMLSIGTGFVASTWLSPTGLGQALSNTSRTAEPRSAPLANVNEEFRPALEQFMKEVPSGRLEVNAASLPQIRRMEAYGRPLLPSPAVEERMIPGSAGAPRVRVYIAGAAPGASKPAVLHIHGGGYVAGTAAAARRSIQEMATTHDCVVVSVDYRLAPETPFPGSLEDNYAALRWLYKNAKELGVDPLRIAIKGESAGGGHAAALAIAARDRHEIPICFQVLIYPMLDDQIGSTRRVPPHIGQFLWTEEANRFGWTSLLGVPAGSSGVPLNSVPAHVASVSDLPPAFIGVGSIDLFCLEDAEYAARLITAGVSTELHIVPGAYHGFDLLAPAASLTIQFKQAWNAALRRAFARS